MPSVTYHLPACREPITPAHTLWHRLLPDHRRADPGSPASTGASGITYGDYFSAVTRFCRNNRWRAVLQALAETGGTPVAAGDLAHIAVVLEKHGAFYHPARLRVQVADRTHTFVVNVAVSADGRRTLPVEVDALRQLNDLRPFGWLPTVFADGVIRGAGGNDLFLFLGSWFEGYHEFHLTDRSPGGEPAIAVWDRDGGNPLLDEAQSRDLYRNAAMILTACYDPVTTCQIFPWDHAAGDFVVRREEKALSVRLITARGYAPMLPLNRRPVDEKTLLEALAVFFVHLTVRMRLDRLDGVSKVVWAPAASLAPTLEGFFQGLDLTARMSGFPATFPDLFRQYLGQQDRHGLVELSRRIVRAVYPPAAEAHRVVARRLADHIRDIGRCLSV